MRFAGHWVVVCNSETGEQRQLLEKSELPANGSIYAIAADTMQLAWEMPGRLLNMAVPLIQPRNSPYLIAYRSSPQAGRFALKMAVVDLRSGSLAYAVDGQSVQGERSFSMELLPEKGELAIAVGEMNFRLVASDRPPAPEPVVHFGGVYVPKARLQLDVKDIFGSDR
jgi:hypothetical protein